MQNTVAGGYLVQQMVIMSSFPLYSFTAPSTINQHCVSTDAQICFPFLNSLVNIVGGDLCTSLVKQITIWIWLHGENIPVLRTVELLSRVCS